MNMISKSERVTAFLDQSAAPPILLLVQAILCPSNPSLNPRGFPHYDSTVSLARRDKMFAPVPKMLMMIAVKPLLLLTILAILNGSSLRATPLDDFIAAARQNHGAPGEKAARFLVEHMPDKDRETLTEPFLTENLNLAFKARAEFPWARQIPEDLFHNDVLPYAVFDETRDPWRADFYEKASKIVTDARAQTAAEAAQALNKELFKLLNVHYNTARKRPNQSPRESIAISRATCTGLSIILVDACRAVGIPARAAGTPMWTNERGNHTWAEIWDGQWHFTGADEYDSNGLDRGWFVGDAAQAQIDSPRHAIYATSWKREGLLFPTVWSRRDSSVAAVNVTARYAKNNNPEAANYLEIGIRLWDKKGGERLRSRLCLFDGNRRQCGVAETKAGRADLNDMPRFTLKPGAQGTFRFTIGAESREIPFGPVTKDHATIDAIWSDLTPTTEPSNR